MSRFSLIAAAVAAVLGTATVATAAETAPQDVFVVQQNTNFILNRTFNKFDTSLGTLTGIRFDLTGNVFGSFGVESLDAAPSTVDARLSATVTLERPDNSIIVITLPVFSALISLTAFDGTIDFAGTSGASRDGLTGTDSQFPHLAAPAERSRPLQGPGHDRPADPRRRHQLRGWPRQRRVPLQHAGFGHCPHRLHLRAGARAGAGDAGAARDGSDRSGSGSSSRLSLPAASGVIAPGSRRPRVRSR